jgi:hypothetical protein
VSYFSEAGLSFHERNLLLKPMKQVVDGLVTSIHTIFKTKYRMLLQVQRPKTPLQKNEEGTEYHVIPLHNMHKQGRPTNKRKYMYKNKK